MVGRSKLAALTVLSGAVLCAADSYLFTSFRSNGETGVFFAISEEFLAKHLGGRYEPLGEIKGHSGVEK